MKKEVSNREVYLNYVNQYQLIQIQALEAELSRILNKYPFVREIETTRNLEKFQEAKKCNTIMENIFEEESRPKYIQLEIPFNKTTTHKSEDGYDCTFIDKTTVKTIANDIHDECRFEAIRKLKSLDDSCHMCPDLAGAIICEDDEDFYNCTCVRY